MGGGVSRGLGFRRVDSHCGPDWGSRSAGVEEVELELRGLHPENVHGGAGVGGRGREGAGLALATPGPSGFVDMWPKSLLPSPGWGLTGDPACWWALRHGEGLPRGSHPVFPSQSRMMESRNWRAMQDTRRYRHHYPVRSGLRRHPQPTWVTPCPLHPEGASGTHFPGHLAPLVLSALAFMTSVVTAPAPCGGPWSSAPALCTMSLWGTAGGDAPPWPAVMRKGRRQAQVGVLTKLRVGGLGWTLGVFSSLRDVWGVSG